MASQVWLKTYRESGIPAHIDPNAHRSVVAMLEAAMKTNAGRPAFHSFGQTLTYADVDRQSRHFAAYLQKKLGVKKGDRIAVMMPNLLAFPIAFLGIIRAGAAQVNVNPLYTPRELEHQLKDAGVSIMVVFAGSSATVAEVMASTPLQTVITAGPGDGSAAKLPSPPVDPRLTGALAFADILAEGAALTFDPVDLDGDDLLFLQYTGGTTGLSKGAALSHRNLIANTEQFKAAMSSSPPASHDVIVTAIPLYHIFALMVNFITYFSVGADNWLVANPRDMDGFVQTLDQAKPTVFMGVNTLYAGLVAHPKIREVDFSNLRLSGGGGAAVIAAVSDKWQEITGQFIREGYGLSETSPVLTFNPMYLTEFSGTTGLPLPSTDIKLLDDEGREVALGQAGRNLRQGPAGDARLLGQARGQCGGVYRRRLLQNRRCRRVRRQGVFEDRRPVEGHDPRLRLQCLSERGRGGRDRLPRRAGMRLHRRARREIRRGGQTVRRQDAERNADSRGIAGVLPQGNDRLQDAENHPVHRRAAEIQCRQDPAPRIARPGGCGEGLITPPAD